MKYDTWHKEIVSKFASHLGDSMADFYTAVSKVGITWTEMIFFDVFS